MPILHGLQILENAKRLLEDARLLRSHRRYPSTVSLAVLSLEEAAKFAMVNKCLNVGNSISGGENNHSAKQRVAGELLIGDLLMSDADEIFHLKREKNSMLSMVFSGERTMASQVADVISEISDDEYETLLKKRFKNYKYNKILFDVISGKFNSVKKKGFYVDIDNTVGMIDRPYAIDREMADRAISLARNCIRQIRSKIAHLERMEKLFPDASSDNQTQAIGESAS